MAKRGGFPGGGGMPGNMANLMKQAQKMQRQMEEQAKAMETKEFTATAGGGAIEVTVTGTKKIQKIKLNEEVVGKAGGEMVQVTMNGKKEIKSIKLDKTAVDPDDVEMLEDLLVVALNEAMDKVDAESQSAMSKFGGGMPGMF